MDEKDSSSTQTPPSEEPQSPPAEPKEESVRTIHGFKWFLVCISLYVGSLIYGLDTTIAADIQAAIIKRFDNVDQLTWVGTGFPLGSVCAILPAAAFYAVFDLKMLFIASVVLFEVGSVLCGAAPDMNALIVGRVLAGLGGSGVYIGILNYFSLCTTNQERGRYVSGIGLVWGVGAILGPVVGGSFSDSSATWRWSFYINLVIAAICAPVYLFYLPSVKPPAASNESILRRLGAMDWMGFILSSGAMVCFVMVLTFDGAGWAWDDGRSIATWVVFGVLLIATTVQQKFKLLTDDEHRMTPPGHILTNRSQILFNIQTAATVANIYVPLYYIPLYFQFVQGDTAVKAAVRLLPFILLLVCTNMASGALLPRIGYYWAIYVVTGVLMTVGGALMYTVNIDTNPGNVYGYSVLLAIGSGLTFQAGYTLAGIKVSLKGWSGKDIQMAVSLQNISQVGGTLLCLLISGQIFQSLAFSNLKAVLEPAGYSDADIRTVVAGTQSSIFEHLSSELARESTEAITRAMSRVYTISIAAGGLSLIAALLMKKERLFGKK
ncbi:MFS general substrate transporter [Aspergillus steynii IBT 23096]|uniref:MFS general substrate transporter n=1 Tax=Aspergillus steynii IBT 23096 TaxID=1392250 RepID=A0A2I2GEW2_9EURO|nr:MFS general substrate transporter [Aspergillus steynii IBT 23096]PLB51419.1 MFS general substrate transporter [Aspergillus steynii IBT 23096]